jgi:PIN domain nuclease of toxin-antitoxin system
VRLLLDTRVLIWWDEGAKLSAKAGRAIREAEQVYVSAASAWEIAIKASLGRLSSTRTAAIAAAESGFEELPVRTGHAEVVQDLPWHHRDPYDRMLVAQAMVEGLTVVTRDSLFQRYDVKVLKA